MRSTVPLGKLAVGAFVVTMLAACGGGGPAAVGGPASQAPTSSAALAPASPAASAKAPASSAPASAKPAAASSAAPAASGPSVALPKPELTSFKTGTGAHEADAFAPDYALTLGLYKKYGLQTVDSVYLDSDARVRQALLAGQIDSGNGGPGSAVTSLTTDVPLITVATRINKPTDVLVAAKNIKTAADLKGKKVAVSSLGGDSHASVLLSLKALGLQPGDVTIVALGGEGARAAALAAGSIAAAPVGIASADKLSKQGLSVLVRLADSDQPLTRSSMYVRRDWAQKYPNTVLNIVAADLEAVQMMFTQKDKAIDELTKWVGSTDRAAQAQNMELYLKLAQRDGRSTPQGWENLKEVMVTADPALKNVDVSKAYTNEYLDKLKALGFFKAMGIPES